MRHSWYVPGNHVPMVIGKALSYLCLVLDLDWTDGNQNTDLILLA